MTTHRGGAFSIVVLTTGRIQLWESCAQPQYRNRLLQAVVASLALSGKDTLLACLSLQVRPAPQSLIASQQMSVVIDHAAVPRLPSTATCSDNGLAGRVSLVRRGLCCQFAVVPEFMTDILPLYGKHARITLHRIAVVFRLG
jgi:hypothetical protein